MPPHDTTPTRHRRNPRPDVEHPCEHCGKSFLAKQSEIDKGRGRFCGNDCYHTASRVPIADRFWSHVNKDGPIPEHRPDLGPCWIWLGGVNNGYGAANYGKGKPVYAHRLSWELHFGPIPDGLRVLHHCDNRACVNAPNGHLFLGTLQDNSDDMIAKGRHAMQQHPERALKGSQNSNAKLTEKDVLVIRTRYAAGGITQPALAVEYGVSAPVITNIINRKSWRHI